jgi:hypothetical protein
MEKSHGILGWDYEGRRQRAEGRSERQEDEEDEDEE